MSEPPTKTKIWQIHLSTAILLMFVAGLLMKMQVRTASLYSGWPVPAYTPYIFLIANIDGDDEISSAAHWIVSGVVEDALISLLILLFICVIGEWLIRLREGRKP